MATLLALALSAAGCDRPADGAHASLGPLAARAVEGDRRRDHELDGCQARLAALRAEPPMPGAPALERARVELLGRAKGEPALFVAEPPPTPDEALSPAAQATRRAMATRQPAEQLRMAMQRHYRDYPTLRALLLRDGYVYAAEPEAAYVLVKQLELPKLFDDPEIWLQRGSEWHRLRRTGGRFPEYRHVDGPLRGAPAEILWADRVTADRAALGVPVHRDVRALADELGFDRARVVHLGPERLALELRFGTEWALALLAAKGASLELDCLAAPRAERERIARWREAEAPRRRALAELRRAVTAMVVERLPFDRPRGAKDHLTDGKLRPGWRWAYRRGSTGFRHEEEGYVVFDADGRPAPPQMCVDFVLDSFERAAGTWYRPRGEAPERRVGRLDFDALGVGNRAGVLAFGTFAETHPEVFAFRRLPERERIPFGERRQFFASLLEHAAEYAPGDVVAIQGVKRDGFVHQHAILIERTDPMTGFPYGLADQMKWPRRRTWEGIMGEAPRRSLLFHVRLRPEHLLKLDPGPAASPERG